MPNRPHLHSRRATWLVLLLAMIYSPMEQSAAQCDKCTDAIISLYDASVLVPRPDDAESIIKWRLLFWVSAVARNWNHTQDPTRECFTWIDGGVNNAQDLQNGTLKFGAEFANVPPQGAVKTPYLLTGSISQVDTALFEFSWQLECGTTREIVKKSVVQFSWNDQAQVDQAYAIGGRSYTTGRLAGREVVLVLSGTSLVNAALTAQAVIDHFNATGIVFSGIAGGVNPELAATIFGSGETAGVVVPGRSLCAVCRRGLRDHQRLDRTRRGRRDAARLLGHLPGQHRVLDRHQSSRDVHLGHPAGDEGGITPPVYARRRADDDLRPGAGRGEHFHAPGPRLAGLLAGPLPQ